MRHIKPSSLGVSLVVIIPILWKGITCVPGYSIQVSSSVHVQEGLCVTIPCNFTAAGRNTFRNSFGYWIRMPHNSDYIVATNDKSSIVKKTNFHLKGNPDTGDCTLTITGARKEDAGKYNFRFEESKNSPVKYSYINEITSITVSDLTEEPVIWDLGTLTAGIDKTVTCAPPGNCPVTSLVIQWKKSDVSDIWKNSSTITFTPSPDDHQKTITCEMTNSRGRTTRRSILLDVVSLNNSSSEDRIGIKNHHIFAPGYSIQVNSSVSVQEGLCVTIPCTFTANNRTIFNNSYGYWMQGPTYSDYIVATNDKPRKVQKTNFHLTGNPDTGDCTLTITGARKEDEGEYYFRFEESKNTPVKYSYIKEITSITVSDLTEEPVIWDLGTLTAGIDKTVTCTPPGNCPVTSLVIQWKKSDVSGIWKNSSTITFTPSLDDHQKNITCEMTNSRGKTTRRSILLDVVSLNNPSREAITACSLDSPIIIGMVIGNIVALILIYVGSYFCLKRRMEKRQLERGSSDPGKLGTESTYEDLKGQQNDIYYNLKVQK